MSFLILRFGSCWGTNYSRDDHFLIQKCHYEHGKGLHLGSGDRRQGGDL